MANQGYVGQCVEARGTRAPHLRDGPAGAGQRVGGPRDHASEITWYWGAREHGLASLRAGRFIF